MSHPARRLTLLLALSAAALAGCDKAPPGGAVIATVDGQEITTWQLQAEARAAQVRPEGADGKKIRDALLDQIITRQVFVNAARKEGLDRKPEVVADRLRQEQIYLAGLALEPNIAPVKPSGAEIDAFIKANPMQFAQRQQLHVEQIRFATAAQPKSIEKKANLGDVAAYLRALNIPYEADDPVLDSARLPPLLTAKLIELKGREPVFFSTGGTTYFNTLIERAPIAQSPEMQRTIARRQLEVQGRQAQIAATIAKLRAASKISYQKGYEPGSSAPPDKKRIGS
jgi:EpsD family peptidyl-prolyl cis-trans isomerase